MNQEYIDKNIRAVLDGADVSVAEQKELTASLSKALLARLFYAVMEKLSEDDRDTMLDLMEDADTSSNTIENFLDGAIAQYDLFFTETVDHFLKDVQQGMQNPSA